MSSQNDQASEIPLQVRDCTKAFIRQGNRLLLVKEQHADHSRFWTFPGGGVRETGDHEAALTHELREELQCQIAIRSPGGECWYAHQSFGFKLSQWTVFRCELHSDLSPNLAEGILDCKWVQPKDLPARTVPQVQYLLRNDSVFSQQ